MKITLHPDYAHLSAFVERLPDVFDNEGELIYQGRNKIRVFETDRREKIAVKSFRIPRFFNRMIYTFVRASKAERSYRHSLLLQARGIETPPPIACIEERAAGLLSRSYYVSAYLDYSGIMREAAYHPLGEIKELAEAFGCFTAEMHNKGIVHLDYSPGNILYKKTENGYRFALLDTNRMRFVPAGSVSLKDGCHNLRKLWGSNETIACIAEEYARCRGFNREAAVSETLRQHARFWKRYSRRHSGAKPYHAG